MHHLLSISTDRSDGLAVLVLLAQHCHLPVSFSPYFFVQIAARMEVVLYSCAPPQELFVFVEYLVLRSITFRIDLAHCCCCCCSFFYGRFDACSDPTISRPDVFTLVLRKWCNLHPSMLFRCFVRGRRLVGECVLLSIVVAFLTKEKGGSTECISFSRLLVFLQEEATWR